MKSEKGHNSHFTDFRNTIALGTKSENEGTAKCYARGCSNTGLDDTVLLPCEGLLQHAKTFHDYGPNLHKEEPQKARRHVE